MRKAPRNLRMLKRALAIGTAYAINCTAALASNAEPVLGEHLIAELGQPLCLARGDLEELNMAMAKNDAKWIGSIRNCRGLPDGAEYVVIEVEGRPAGSNRHPARIRLLSGEGPAVGWTVIAPDQ